LTLLQVLPGSAATDFADYCRIRSKISEIAAKSRVEVDFRGVGAGFQRLNAFRLRPAARPFRSTCLIDFLPDNPNSRDAGGFRQ
jgi:hypothetical protein